jgi:phage terminase large subunit
MKTQARHRTPKGQGASAASSATSVSPIVRDSILTFAQVFLQTPLYPWQHELVRIIEKGAEYDRIRVALSAPNGSGKSSVCVAVSILNWLRKYPRGKVVLTTADAKQLDSQIMPSLARHRAKFPAWDFLGRSIRTPEGGMMLAFTTDEASRAEGHHSAPDAPLLIIIDEAKSVENEIFQAIDRCSFSVLLMVSSPGLKMGRFYDAFSVHRDRYLYTRQVGLQDCPHISKERIQDVIETYGERAPFVRSTIYGEFMAEDESTPMAVSYERLRALLECPPHARLTGETTGFCDFAAGGDENVLAIRSGNKLLELIAWRERDTSAAVGRFIIEFRRHGLRASQIWGDAGGLGTPMCDMLRDAGWPINRSNFGAKARNEQLYTNVATELWAGLARQIERGEIVLLDDPTLFAQLTTRKLLYDARGRVRIEPKDILRNRGVKSPDRADAVAAAFYYGGNGFYRPSQHRGGQGNGSGFYRPSLDEDRSSWGFNPHLSAEQWYGDDSQPVHSDGLLDGDAAIQQRIGGWPGG